MKGVRLKSEPFYFALKMPDDEQVQIKSIQSVKAFGYKLLTNILSIIFRLSLFIFKQLPSDQANERKSVSAVDL